MIVETWVHPNHTNIVILASTPDGIEISTAKIECLICGARSDFDTSSTVCADSISKWLDAFVPKHRACAHAEVV